MTFNMQHLIDFVRDFPPGTPAERRFDLAAKRWPALTVANMVEAANILAEECEEKAEQAERIAKIQEEMEIMRGCSEDATLEQVVAFKAALGDPLALKLFGIINSVGYRKGNTLMAATCAAHPQFERGGRGWVWKGDGKGPSPEAMLDWFQMNHPTQARAIEAEIEGELRSTVL